ncbi:hypothetical protein DPMN_173931 [Dreissena polymorpha]|uniref:SGNH hydrolase-type esterase domain-containing protein n=1 Tax=Dreissena polymorpha TaxID=45954 RepID=A0A9D4E642_DREPO|nr:hypothetical protein DPMN_173931 [Dreissena polymorpha]
MPGELRFFAKGGMTAARPDVDLLQELKTFQPHVVVVVLGGNDICTSSSPADIVSSLLRLQTQLHEAGTTHVHFCNICERGYFPKDRAMTKKCFNAQRNKINDCLNKNASVIELKKIRFPADYHTDMVHMNEVGNNKLFRHIRGFLFGL